MVATCVVLLFFFFQAEDGIRDYKVTGVQTCALPIYYACELNTPVSTAVAPKSGTITRSPFRCFSPRRMNRSLGAPASRHVKTCSDQSRVTASVSLMCSSPSFRLENRINRLIGTVSSRSLFHHPD